MARAQRSQLVIGLDSNSENLSEISRKASLKESKGGVSNLLFGHLALEQGPDDLEGICDSMSVILPWGSLLRSVAFPDLDLLLRLRRFCKPHAKLNIIFGYSASADPGMVSALSLPALNGNHLAELEVKYRSIGIHIRANTIPVEEVRVIPSSWAKKLAFSGKERTFVKLVGRIN